jgi:hypothetical protein
MKAAKETACTEQGFLRHVLGISSPAQKPTREVESSIEVRKYQLLKAHPVFELQLTHKSPLKVRPHE